MYVEACFRKMFAKELGRRYKSYRETYTCEFSQHRRQEKKIPGRVVMKEGHADSLVEYERVNNYSFLW